MSGDCTGLGTGCTIQRPSRWPPTRWVLYASMSEVLFTRPTATQYVVPAVQLMAWKSECFSGTVGMVVHLPCRYCSAMAAKPRSSVYPTAMQSAGAPQEAPLRVVCAAPLTSGTPTMRHLPARSETAYGSGLPESVL